MKTICPNCGKGELLVYINYYATRELEDIDHDAEDATQQYLMDLEEQTDDIVKYITHVDVIQLACTACARTWPDVDALRREIERKKADALD